jgi:predicted pyridoxine 5'-phosphate oxidase superfamily flavin-nucleotide-binding protein
VHRRLVPATVLVVGLGGAILLSGCSQQGGLDLARQACTHVDRSIHLYKEAEATDLQSTARTRLQQAYNELRAALPLAAAATSDDGRWNALMTAISESARVNEAQLITALQDECAVAAGSQTAAPNPMPAPSSTTPTPTRPQNGF